MHDHTPVCGIGTAEEYRLWLIEHFGLQRRLVELLANEPGNRHGYKLSAHALAALSRALDNVEDTLRRAEVERPGALDGVPAAVAQCVAQAVSRSAGAP